MFARRMPHASVERKGHCACRAVRGGGVLIEVNVPGRSFATADLGQTGSHAPVRWNDPEEPHDRSRAAPQSQLEDRLKALDSRLHEIEDELDSHQSKDWEELATEREDDEVLERLGVSGQEEIAASAPR
jgi:hypothetical protein